MRKLLSLIPREYRRGCINVALLVPFKAILDLVGVAVLLPVMVLVLDPARLEASFLGKWVTNMGYSIGDNFGITVLTMVVAVLVLKVILSLCIQRYQSTFLSSLYRELSSRLFISLYSRGLVYIKNQNSARMTFNVTGVCYNFVMCYLGGWMKLIGELCFVLLLFAALMVYSAKATLFALITFLPVLGLYALFIRKPLKDISSKENEIRREQNKLLYEAFRGYSEVQINDAFPQIQQRFRDGLKTIAGYRVRSGIIQSLPSYLLELSVVLMVAVYILSNHAQTGASGVVFLGVFGVALLKLLPAVRSIIGCISTLNATQYTCEVVADMNVPVTFDLLHHDEVVSPMSFEHEIKVDGVTFAFPDDETPVLDGVSFTIPKGARIGIKGRTGAGKTTLFNILLGLYQPQSGFVKIDGVPLTAANSANWHSIVGYVPQDVFVSDSTILENVALGCEMGTIDRQKAEEALRQASLLDFVESLPSGIYTKIGEAGCKMSGGQRQRLGIARALYKDAAVLFFDEATSSLDSQTETEVNSAIADLSKTRSELTVIVISHRDTTMSYCDTIIEL